MLASQFFSQVIDRHTEKFKQRKKKHIHPLLACEDLISSRVMAACFLGIPPLQTPEQNFYCETHRTTINTTDLCSFLFQNMDAAIFRQKKFYQTHQQAIRRITSGESLWESESNEMRTFRNYVRENWLTIPTNTQLVERWVKDCNECTSNTREKNVADAIAILRSTTVF